MVTSEDTTTTVLFTIYLLFSPAQKPFPNQVWVTGWVHDIKKITDIKNTNVTRPFRSERHSSLLKKQEQSASWRSTIWCASEATPYS